MNLDREQRNILSKFLTEFQSKNNLSDNEMIFWLTREVCKIKDNIPYPAESKEWDKAYKEKEKEFAEKTKPTYSILWDLYKILEQEVVNFLIDHPDVLKNLQETRDEILNLPKTRSNCKPDVGFTFGFDDIFGRLKYGTPGSGDIYCGFNVGTRSITLC